MPASEHYDAVVVGAGASGKLMTWHLGSLGKRVAVVERRYLGGSCPNIACLPSKNVIHSAKVASYLSRQGEFGLPRITGGIDMARVRARKDEMVANLHAVHVANFEKSKAEILWGTGRFVEPRTVTVTAPGKPTRTVQGDMVFLDTGSRAAIDPIPGLREAVPLTHVEALDLGELPRHLLVLGGSYVGLEFAQAFRRLGSRVSVVERSERILPREDPDVSEGIGEAFAAESIDVHTGVVITSVAGRSGERVRLSGRAGHREIALEGSHLLVATGRIPNTEDVDPATGGVEVTERGTFRVNERLETSAERVWAMGDCAGSPYFTHIAEHDFRIVRDNLFGGRKAVTTGRQVPYCLYTDPEFAHVGLRESEANEKGIPYRLATISMKENLRAGSLSETRGFLKALVGDDDRVLGFSAMAVNAGELLPVVQLAMLQKLPYTAFADIIVTHPTISEGLFGLFTSLGRVPL
jgi:pyruvate/2-oxoglutarate dehydrogenase complex dihydrolipoamide dehydrogenase (E3) component